LCEYYNIEYEDKIETGNLFEEFEDEDENSSEKFDISDLFDDFDEK